MTFATYYFAAMAFFAGSSPYGGGFLYSPAFFYLFSPFLFMGYVGGMIAFTVLTSLLWVWVATRYLKEVHGKLRWFLFIPALEGAILFTSANIDAVLAAVIILAWYYRKQLGVLEGIILGFLSFKPIFVPCYLLFLWTLWNRKQQLFKVACGAIMGIILAWAPFLPWVIPMLQSILQGDSDMPAWIPVWFHFVYLVPWHYSYLWYCAACYKIEKKRRMFMARWVSAVTASHI